MLLAGLLVVSSCVNQQEECGGVASGSFPSGSYVPRQLPLIAGAQDVTLTVQHDAQRAVVTFTKDGQRYRAVYALSGPPPSLGPQPPPRGVIRIQSPLYGQGNCPDAELRGPTIDAIALERDGRVIASAQGAELVSQWNGWKTCDAPFEPETVLGAPDGKGWLLGNQRLELKLARGAFPLPNDVVHVYASGDYRVMGKGFSVEGTGKGSFTVP